jgi:hypothetical protein
LLDEPAQAAALQSKLAALGWHDATPLLLDRIGALLGLGGVQPAPGRDSISSR